MSRFYFFNEESIFFFDSSGYVRTNANKSGYFTFKIRRNNGVFHCKMKDAKTKLNSFYNSVLTVLAFAIQDTFLK